MDKRIVIAGAAVLVLIVIIAIVYSYGQEAGAAAGAATAVAMAEKYRRRGQESQRLDGVIDDAHKDAHEIRDTADEITDTNLAEAKAKSGDELANEIDRLT